MGLEALLLLFATFGLAQLPKRCPQFTSDGCAKCTTEKWLDGLKYCGFCHDADNLGCRDGGEGGPFDGPACVNWEWYDGGVKGGKVRSFSFAGRGCSHVPKQCCGDVTTCVGCSGAEPGCAWCEAEQVCVEKTWKPFCNRSNADECCSYLTTCGECNAQGDGGCGWCDTTNQCLPTAALQSCAVVADQSCCSVLSSCAACGADAACAWCDAPLPGSPACAPKTPGCQAPAVADPECCSDKAGCGACNAKPGLGCGWCTAQPQRCTTQNLGCAGGVYADSSCCEAQPDCASCHAVPGCQFCLQDGMCHSNATQLCPNPADDQCCNVLPGQSCAGCVGLPGCGFCTATRRCTNAPCATLNVEGPTAWQCGNPLLINCESFDSCGPCVATSGCVWIGTVWINGEPQPHGLCFTGGLFGLSNSQVPGFVVTTPAGFFWQTCSMTATSLLILIGSLVGGAVAVAVLVTVACVCVRRRRLRLAGNDASAHMYADSSVVNVDTQPLTSATDGVAAAAAAPKKKKKRVAKPMAYEKPVESVRATNTRYYQSRKK